MNDIFRQSLQHTVEIGSRFFASLQVATTVIGLIAVSMSVMLAALFFRNRTRVSFAFALMLAAESVGLAITVVFSLSLFGVFDVMTPEIALVSRLVIFFTAMASSIHLAFRLWTINEETKP